MLELFSIFILSPIYGISKFIEYAMPVPIINIINEEGIFFTDLNLITINSHKNNISKHGIDT